MMSSYTHSQTHVFPPPKIGPKKVATGGNGVNRKDNTKRGEMREFRQEEHAEHAKKWVSGNTSRMNFPQSRELPTFSRNHEGGALPCAGR